MIVVPHPVFAAKGIATIIYGNGPYIEIAKLPTVGNLKANTMHTPDRSLHDHHSSV